MTSTTSVTGDVDTDVLVVGAGPIGLALACALTHHGVGTRIVDRRSGPPAESRANNLWSRPQELLAGIGVRDVLAADAHEVRRADVVLDGQPVDTIDFAQVSSPYPTVLYSSQAVYERRLRDVLHERGVTVEDDTVLDTLHQDADGVDARLSRTGDAAGGQVQVRARYVVGADGVQSAVRDAVGIELPTEDLDGRATRQIDAVLHWRRPTTRDALWFFTYHHGFAGVLPITGEHHRLFFVEDETEVPDREPTLEEMQERARKVTGDPTVTLSDPVWASRGRFSHGVATRHADRRVLLAGDAGHLNLPIGGQGMNAGLHDAVGLAWRLAMTLAGCAGDVVLDSYATERGAEHARLGRQQVTGFRRLMYRNQAEDTALRLTAKVIPNLGAQLFGADELQQLAVGYRDSPLAEDHAPARTRRSAPRAGDRAPDARVTSSVGTTTTLFQHLYNPDGHTWGWCLLAFDGRDGRSHDALAAAVAAVSGHSWVHPRLVVADPAADVDVAAGATAALFDLDGDAHTAYGARRRPALVLVRPDGHIAFRAPAERADLLAAYCTRVERTEISTSASRCR